MPRKRSAKAVYRKRSGYRKMPLRRRMHKANYKRAHTLGNPLTVGPFPKELYTKLNYNLKFELDSTTSTLAAHTFSLNSLFDPDVTGGGIQPRFYDNLLGGDGTQQPYNKYRVMACKAECHFINDNSNGTTCGIVFIHWRDATNSPLADLNDIDELPNVKKTDLGVADGSRGIRTLSKYVKIAPMLGIKDMKDNSDAGAAYNTGPSREVYLDVGYQPYGTGITTSITVRLILTYYCQLYEQNVPTYS